MSDVKFITSTANPLIKEIKALEMRKRRKETNLFVAEGLRTLIEGMELNADLQTLVYLTAVKDKPEVARVRDYCIKNGGTVVEVNDVVLEKISRKENPQSVIGVFRQKLKRLRDVPMSGTWVVLEEVRDPGNLGTIIRTIDSVGASGAILIGNCCDPYSFESVRATMGSIFLVPIITATQEEFLDWRQDWSGQVYGTTLQNSVDYREVAYQEPILLMMGNEQAGLTDAMRDVCTSLIRLPMIGRADSLNLSIATGVMLYMIEDKIKER